MKEEADQHSEYKSRECSGHETLSSTVKLIAWAFILFHLDVNLGSINLLPSWLGYLLILHTIPALAAEEESVSLLRPLCILLAAWNIVLWFITIPGIQINIYIPQMMETALSLYFNFQFLTNLATIAKQYGCPQQKRILNLRTVRTILITVLVLPIPWKKYTVSTVIIITANVITALWICITLFSMAHTLNIEISEEV